MLRTFLEFRVEIVYEDEELMAVFIMGKDGYPKVDVLYCMSELEKGRATLAALEAIELQQSRREAMEEDRNRE